MSQKQLNLMTFQTKVIKGNYDIFGAFITENFNNMIENSVFPVLFKQVDITRIYRKDSRNEKENYRPVIILPNLSKIYELLVYTDEQVLTLFFLNTNFDLDRDILHSNIYLP